LPYTYLSFFLVFVFRIATLQQLVDLRAGYETTLSLDYNPNIF
jgi:hypothetical protein